MSQQWQTSRFVLNLDRPQIMGIVNVTPDSFSDGGRHAGVSGAMAHAEQLLKDGAHILDIGGESTRPGSPAVPLEQELERVLPVLAEAVKLQVPISIDTYKPEVMRAALSMGADIINVLNRQVAGGYNPRYETATRNQPNQFYNQEIQIAAPRYIRFMARYDF